jgi:DNA-directed RNA polymerase subunit RPC12/RpoP
MSPMYEYKCSCGNHYEAHHLMGFRDCEVCPDCGFKPERVFSLNAKPVVYEYFSESLMAKITGPKQKQRILKEKNMSEVG